MTFLGRYGRPCGRRSDGRCLREAALCPLVCRAATMGPLEICVHIRPHDGTDGRTCMQGVIAWEVADYAQQRRTLQLYLVAMLWFHRLHRGLTRQLGWYRHHELVNSI